MSATICSSLNTSHNLSFVHCNVQSVLPKLDILHAELLEFNILAFTETDDTDDLLLHSYNRPECRDLVDDNPGSVILYIKEGKHYKHRNDLEI